MNFLVRVHVQMRAQAAVGAEREAARQEAAAASAQQAQRLAQVEAQLAAALAERARLEADTKRAFMRGVCALNIEVRRGRRWASDGQVDPVGGDAGAARQCQSMVRGAGGAALKQLVDCVPGCSCLHDLQALGLMKTGAAPTSADAITQLLQQAGEAASEEQHEVQMLQKAATSTVQQQCPAGEQLLARKGWATEAGAPGMAAAATAAMPPQRQQQAHAPLLFASSGDSRPQSPAGLFSPLVCLAASQPAGAPLPPSSAPSAAVRQGSQLRPGSGTACAMPCSLPSNVPPLIAAMLTARGQRAAAASPRRPATAPPKRQQQPARPATTGAATAPGQQQLVTCRSLAGQQRGTGVGGQPLVVRGAVAMEGSAGAAARRGPGWGR